MTPPWSAPRTRSPTTTRARYPDLNIPFHSRWRHFEAGGVDRSRLDAAGTAVHRAMIDLAVVSVLLDAGAGPDWHYDEAQSGQRFTRSEGLGVASWHAFSGGLFSSDPATPLRADAAGLRRLDLDRLADAFQVRPSESVGGLGRSGGGCCAGSATRWRRQPEVFGSDGRPGGLFDVVVAEASGPSTASRHCCPHVLTSFASIWPSRNVIGDEPLGDCWRHAAVPGPGLTAGLGAVSQAVAVVDVLAARTLRWAGVQVADARCTDRAARIPQRRAATRHRGPAVA